MLDVLEKEPYELVFLTLWHLVQRPGYLHGNVFAIIDGRDADLHALEDEDDVVILVHKGLLEDRAELSDHELVDAVALVGDELSAVALGGCGLLALDGRQLLGELFAPEAREVDALAETLHLVDGSPDA